MASDKTTSDTAPLTNNYDGGAASAAPRQQAPVMSAVPPAYQPQQLVYQQQQPYQLVAQPQYQVQMVPQPQPIATGYTMQIPQPSPHIHLQQVPPGAYTTHIEIQEPHEAAVSRPLSIISLFCFFQLWFSIPAIVLAYSRNGTKSKYNASIALSLTAIILGMIGALAMMSMGLVLPAFYCEWNGSYPTCYSG